MEAVGISWASWWSDLYLWDGVGQSKAVGSSSIVFDISVIICSFGHPGFSLHECTVSVARIVTLSFIQTDSGTK